MDYRRFTLFRLPLGTTLLLWVGLIAGPLSAQHATQSLPIGDLDRRDREAPLVVDGVTDTSTGQLITPTEMVAQLADVPFLFVGESHTSEEFHRVQLQVIEALHEAGREVIIGLEMFPYTRQESLDQWTRGWLTEKGFLEVGEWYDSWGYPFDYYRDIFLFARDHELSMVAVNAPRHVVRAVRQKGVEGLTEEEKKHVPPSFAPPSEEHARLFKAHFDPDDPMHSSMSEEQWASMIEAQTTWDAAMGYHAVQALEGHGEKAIVVVLIGSGHVAYGLGIERQSQQWHEGPFRSLIPIAVEDDEEAIEKVQASFANYLWGVMPEPWPKYPEMGFSSRRDEDLDRRKVIYVSDGSPAAQGGLEVEDVLLRWNGEEIRSSAQIRRWVAESHWGDRIILTVDRGGEEKSLTVFLRRLDEEEES